MLKEIVHCDCLVSEQLFNKDMSSIQVVTRIPIVIVDVADPSVFVTVQVKVLPRAGSLTMSMLSYVDVDLLVTI